VAALPIFSRFSLASLRSLTVDPFTLLLWRYGRPVTHVEKIEKKLSVCCRISLYISCSDSSSLLAVSLSLLLRPRDAAK